MDIFEFELRFRAYQGLMEQAGLELKDSEIIELVKITSKGKLPDKLTETSVETLKEMTLETYTEHKKHFIQNHEELQLENGTLPDYIHRLEYELKVIKEMGYNTYFLVVADYTNRAKENNIAVGPGRGSAGGSLLSFLIGIIDINPIKYDLLFERFLNPARVSMPDIDTDFEDTQRERLLEYVKEKYGREKIATIGTYMSMAAKAAFKDVARTVGMPFEKANKISANITEKTIQKTLDNNEEFKEMVENDEELKKIVDLAIKLEGTIRQTGVHACGVIIAPDKVDEFTPVQHPPKAGLKGERDTTKIVTQYDGHVLEDVGLLKMDFLGLRNLSIIKNTIKIATKKLQQENKEIPEVFEEYFKKTVFKPPLDDQKTYEEIFQAGNTSGVFQFESDGMRSWLKKLKPEDIDNIIAMVALYRPGPMDFIPNYIARKNGEEKVHYIPENVYNELKEKYGKEKADKEVEKITNDLHPFMKVTYGIPIYQEQLMRIVQAMGAFSLGEADILRRGVGKKIREIIDRLKKKFLEQAQEIKGYKEETCIYVYEKMIEPAADYSFNKAHASCYAMIAYQTAFLKAHYPIEFHAAFLRSVEEETEKLAKYIDELKILGLNILPPSVNHSFTHISATTDSIRLGLLGIKGVGYEASKTIEKERKEKGEFKELKDFLKRCKESINKKTLDSLAKSGSLDDLEDRKTIINNAPKILERTKNISETNQSGGGLFDMGNLEPPLEFSQRFETHHIEGLLREYEIFDTFVSGHPFDGLYRYIKSKYNFITMFKEVENYGKFSILCFIKEIRRIPKKGFFVTVEDISGETDIFLKDLSNLKKFDILSIKGYKGKSVRLEEATKIDFDDLVEKAKKTNKYNPEETTMNARKQRLGIQVSNNTQKQSEQENISEKRDSERGNPENDREEENTQGLLEEEQGDAEETEEEMLSEEPEQEEGNTEEETIVEEEEVENFNAPEQDKEQRENALEIEELPTDIEKLDEIIKILKEQKGDKKIIIKQNEYYLTEKGLQKIQKIIQNGDN